MAGADPRQPRRLCQLGKGESDPQDGERQRAHEPASRGAQPWRRSARRACPLPALRPQAHGAVHGHQAQHSALFLLAGLLDNGEPRCIAFGGLRVDDAIEEALLRVVEPGAIAAAAEAEAQAADRRDAAVCCRDGCCAAAAVHACASITSHSRGGCAPIMSATKPSCGTPASIANGCAALQSGAARTLDLVWDPLLQADPRPHHSETLLRFQYIVDSFHDSAAHFHRPTRASPDRDRGIELAVEPSNQAGRLKMSPRSCFNALRTFMDGPRPFVVAQLCDRLSGWERHIIRSLFSPRNRPPVSK